MSLDNKPNRFCWLDLAAIDSGRAADFYQEMFGWQTVRQRANGGELLRLTRDGETFASLYQLGAQQIAGGVPSHWTPYVAVSNIDEAVAKAAVSGGQVVVKPFMVDGMARVSLVADAVGALVGLWEQLR